MGRSELQKLLDQKKKAKDQVFAHYWPALKKDVPLLLIFQSPEHKYQKMLAELLDGLLVLPMQVMIVSNESSEKHGEGVLPANAVLATVNKSRSAGHEGKFVWVNTKKMRAGDAEKFTLAADLSLIFEEHQDTIKNLFSHGVVPVAFEKSPFLENYHPNEEVGNSFTFSSYNPWAIFLALVRSNETYRFPYDWQHIVRGMLKVR